MNEIVKLNPTICVVGNTYQFMIVSEQEAMISICIGDNVYYSHSNGIKLSSPGVHRITVPIEELDNVGKYTVVVEKMIERLPYYPKVAPAIKTTYNYRPIEKTKDINIYHLADVHGCLQQAVNNVKCCGKEIDLLILNGDISSTSNTFDDMILCYKIASEVTKGEIPCIISRGNHDLRGFEAEKLAMYMPGDNGKSYYTFRVGCIWGILVDTGEDKNDDSVEYGGTICCHNFRLEQESMIKSTIKNASVEYADNGVEYKLVISHVPFTFKTIGPFAIEKSLFSRWSKLIKDNIKPDIMLCGHTHKACISENGSEYDELGQPCTIVVGSDVKEDGDGEYILAGALVTLNEGGAKVVFNAENKVLFEKTVVF